MLIVWRPLVLLYGSTVILFAWFWAGMPVVAIPAASIDDARFVGNAARILSGDWLGTYNSLTLAKGAGYPIWLALLAGLGIPALLGQALLYVGAALLLVRALSRWVAHEGVLFGLFLLFLINPGIYNRETLRIMREGFYTPTLVLAFALLLWWVRLSSGPLRPRLILAAGLGLCLGFFHLTREESIWIAPFLLGWLALRGFALFRETAAGRWRSEGMALLACAGAAILPVLSVSALNARHYGFFGTVEFRDPAFISAYASLARLGPDEPSLIVLPNAVLSSLFAASPAASELRPFFDLRRGEAFINVGCLTYAVLPCDDEIRAAWFMWALREAAAIAGHHTGAMTARRFYARLSSEVDAACDRGELRCQPKVNSLAPRFRTAYLMPTLRAAFGLLGVAAERIDSPRPAELRSIFYAPNEWQIMHSAFLDFVHATVYVDPLGSNAAQVAMPEYLRISLGVQRARYVLHAVSFLGQGWGWLGWLFLLVGLLSLVALLPLWVLRPGLVSGPVLAVCCGAWLLFFSRVVLLAYVHAVAIPSVNMLYLSPAMPYAMLACGLGIFLLGRSIRVLTRA